jgi:hypothetical protein
MIDGLEKALTKRLLAKGHGHVRQGGVNRIGV